MASYCPIGNLLALVRLWPKAVKLLKEACWVLLRESENVCKYHWDAKAM